MTTRQPTEFEAFETESADNRRLLRQEELILEVTEGLAALLEESDVSRSELADRLGKSRGFVSQVLNGGRNLTLRTISDFCDALGAAPTFRIQCSPNWVSQVSQPLRYDASLVLNQAQVARYLTSEPVMLGCSSERARSSSSGRHGNTSSPDDKCSFEKDAVG